MYQPVLGRFASRDPLPPNGQPDILYDNNWFGDRLTRMRNLYGYADNNPINRVDPSGLRCDAAKPPDTIIPIDDDYFQSGTIWKPQPPRGYPLAFGANRVASFPGATCDCCTMDIEVVARAYRYYRYSKHRDEFVGHDGRRIGVSNDPRDFVSLMVATVCKTNIVCDGKAQPDEVEVIVSEPLQKRGLGVFIRDVGGIEVTLDKFKSDEACTYGQDAVGFVQQHTQPGAVDPNLRR